MMNMLRIDSGTLYLSCDAQITLDDISALATSATVAHVPGNATVSYLAVDYHPSKPVNKWQVRINWQMPS